jgi:hypothetical protein
MMCLDKRRSGEDANEEDADKKVHRHYMSLHSEA